MESLPVTIIVKAPNQQFEDQTIKCEPTWSIRKLKGYLTEVYPCNPTLEEQKLIYSGQLLNDAHILKDVLRQYEGQEAHTVHLVYTPKNRQQQQSYVTKPTQPARRETTPITRVQPSQTTQQSQSGTTANTDGLRHRNAGTTPAPTTTQPRTVVPPPFLMNGYLNTPQAFMPGMAFAQPTTTNPSQAQPSVQQYMMAQQLAMQNMMNQMYLQYMNQYANGVQSSTPNPNSTTMPSSFPPANAINYPNFANIWNQPAANSLNVDSQAQPQQNDQAPAIQPAQPPPAPRFQGAAAVVVDEEENRDWLEILYTLSRLLVLSSLVYFYSSPGRCSIVIIVALLYYLYQNHQRNLRERQQQERGQADADTDIIDAPVENNEARAENNVNNENNQPAADGGNTPTPASTETNQIQPSSPSGDQDENNRLPTVALLRTFVLSFFSSLIPETPAV